MASKSIEVFTLCFLHQRNYSEVIARCFFSCWNPVKQDCKAGLWLTVRNITYYIENIVYIHQSTMKKIQHTYVHSLYICRLTHIHTKQSTLLSIFWNTNQKRPGESSKRVFAPWQLRYIRDLKLEDAWRKAKSLKQKPPIFWPNYWTIEWRGIENWIAWGV